MTIVPNRGADGSILVAVLRIERLAALHDQQRMQGSGTIGIFRDDGTVLSRAPFDARIMMMNANQAADFQAI